MATIGAPALFAQSRDPTLGAAIPLAAITGTADAENRVASAAHSLPKDNLAQIRHPGRQVGLDKDDGSWQGKTNQVADLMATFYEVAKLGSRRCSGGIPESFSTFPNNLHHRSTFVADD